MSIQTLYGEINEHLLKDEKPSVFLEGLSKEQQLDLSPFNMLEALKETGQSPKYHAEGNVWNHTMLVVDEAAKVKRQSSSERVFMWGALLHDIGKAVTTQIRNGKITAYEHDKAGAEMTVKFFSYFDEPAGFVREVEALVRWHMQILYVTKGLPFAQVKQMKQQTRIEDIALFGLCDRLGRFGADKVQEQNTIRLFIEKCN